MAPTASAQEAASTSLDAATDLQAVVTGYVGDTTATGTQAHWGTIAADWRLYPPGTRVRIDGFPNDVFVVEDSGGGVHGNVFDIWFPDLPTAQSFGTKSLRVTILAAN